MEYRYSDEVEVTTTGDDSMIVATIGNNARGVCIGSNITSSIVKPISNEESMKMRILCNVHFVNIDTDEIISVGPMVAADDDSAKMKAFAATPELYDKNMDDYFIFVDVIAADVPTKPGTTKPTKPDSSTHRD